MTTRQAALGIGVAIAVAYCGLLAATLHALLFTQPAGPSEAAQLMRVQKSLWLVGIPAFVILAFDLTFIARVWRTPDLSDRQKWLWFAALVVGHVLAVPLFWYFRVWRPAAQVQGSGSLEERFAAYTQRTSQRGDSSSASA